MAETEKYYEKGIPLTKKYERFEPRIYNYRGIPHIGYGFNLLDPAMRALIPPDILAGKRPLYKEEADDIFMTRYNQAARDAFNFAGREGMLRLPPQKQAVLVDMAYNLGANGLGSFKKMQEAVRAGDDQRAAAEMKDSDWFKQVGDRGVRNVLTFGSR